MLAVANLRALTIQGAVRRTLARRKYLRRILYAKPIFAGPNAFEAHMLLNHKRIFEGIWSLYSLARFSSHGCRIIIHDDGTLDELDHGNLKLVFPECRIIMRQESDAALTSLFEQKGLMRCAALRDKLIFSLKLFDTVAFAENDKFVLIDSDVLFFSYPLEVFGQMDGNLFSQDNGYRYCLNESEFLGFLDVPCLQRFNPGVMRVQGSAVDFARIDKYLHHKNFWGVNGLPGYYAELTLWAMELTRIGARPLPQTYAICPDPETPNLVSGHYCGGGYWASRYYTAGLPFLDGQILDVKGI